MHALTVLTLILVLAAKALLRAHHGPPLYGWEVALTAVAGALTLTTLVLFVLDAQGLAQ
jgi:hypothetical protein